MTKLAHIDAMTIEFKPNGNMVECWIGDPAGNEAPYIVATIAARFIEDNEVAQIWRALLCNCIMEAARFVGGDAVQNVRLEPMQ